jgi:hypothetical protein
MIMKALNLLFAIAALSFLTGTATSQAAEIVVINFDPPGVGFNDPTPVDPVGNNPGTTLGEQRLIVFDFAAQKWGVELESDVPIFLAAFFQPLFCTPTRAVLGSAGPTFVHRDFPELPLPGTWYVAALAESLTGEDLVPGVVDMVARFNGDIGVNPDCLTGQSWYNGLDHNNDPASEIDLLSVVMHEMAHGLGFLELADADTGSYFFGFPDAYLVNMKDLTTDKQWNEMNDAERLASQVNSGNLVWTGPSVTADAPFILGPRPTVVTLTPPKTAASYEAQQASYGPPLRTNGGTSGKMIVVDDGEDVSTDACEPIRNNVAGKIALIDRGNCSFTVKTFFAQVAGAKGVIIVNNEPAGLPSMGGADDPFFRIPSVGVSNDVGTMLKEASMANSEAKLILDEDFIAGTQDGFVRLYAPNPVAPGSSKSHFDTSATPNLLMEPFINDDLVPSVFLDLTTNLFQDIGWVLQ